VLRRSLILITALILGVASHAFASSMVCSSATGSSTSFTTLPSCSQMFSPTATLDWGSPVIGSMTGPMGSNEGGLGPATRTYAAGSWPETVGAALDAEVGGDAFTIVSNDQLERADNTELAWNGSTWLPAPFVDGSNTYFAGHFGAPSTPASQPQFGENLLGALATSGSSNGPPTITLQFATALAYIAFQVSSASNANFTAQLLAFNSSGVQIGTYQVTDTGGGGFCAGLASNPPQPCDDAALIQFYDPSVSIASVELIIDDLSGMYIDELMASPAAVPEPVSSGLAAFGLLLILSVAKRKPFGSRKSVSPSMD
jgi:hypothetical protein